MCSIVRTGIHTYMSKGLNELLAAGRDGCCDIVGLANAKVSKKFDEARVDAGAYDSYNTASEIKGLTSR